MTATSAESSGSYRPDEADLELELARLKSQVDLTWHQELKLLRSLGLTSSSAVVELGSGPGYVTERLAEAVPEGRVISVEIRADLAELARETLRELGNVEHRQASALDTGLADGAADLVLARFLFQHLDAPANAAAEALRILRPGGRLVVVDMDAALWGLADPMVPALSPIYARSERLQLLRGGSRLAGRMLPRLLKSVGFQEVGLESFVYHSDDLGLEAFRTQMDPRRLVPALDAGLISPAEYAAVVTHTECFFRDPESLVLMLGLLAHGTRAEEAG